MESTSLSIKIVEKGGALLGRLDSHYGIYALVCQMALSAVETVVTPSTKVKGHVARPARDSIKLSTLEHSDGPSAAQIDNDIPQYNSSPEKGLFTKTNLHFATLCWCLFLAGWNDGTIGPLLPRVQGVYDVRLTFKNPILQC